jgi:hypothetical protein
MLVTNFWAGSGVVEITASDAGSNACPACVTKLERENERLKERNAKLESALDQLRHVASRCDDTELSELIKCVTSEGVKK